MENTTAMAATATQDITPEYQLAMELHYRILAGGEAAASALTGLFQNLKRMRDEGLYRHLGVESFRAYLEEKLNIESRQAYTYLSVLDNLQPHLLQSNAGLGITKLALLTQVPPLEREEFLEDNDLDGMSTREIRELVEQMKRQGEQLSLLQERKTELERDNTHLTDKNRELIQVNEELSTVGVDEAAHLRELEGLRAELKELQSRPVEVAVQQPDEDTLEAIRMEAQERAEAEAENKVKQAREKAQQATDKAVAAAREQAAQEAEERFRQNLQALEEEKARAMTWALELERELKAAGDSGTVRFSVLFDEFQENFSKLVGFIGERKAEDTEQGEKFRGALLKALDALKTQAEEL